MNMIKNAQTYAAACLLAAIDLTACAGGDPNQAGPAAEDGIGAVSEALGDYGCTQIASPPSGTSTNQIWSDVLPDQTTGSRTFGSPNWVYGTTGCPRQYVVELNGPTIAPGAPSVSYKFYPQIGALGPLDGSNCAQAHLDVTVWKKQNGPYAVAWLTTPAVQFTATGVWETFPLYQKCIFYRDDNGAQLTDKGSVFTMTAYQQAVRFAINARMGSSYHSTGVAVTPPQ